jgi:hypothetical protein
MAVIRLEAVAIESGHMRGSAQRAASLARAPDRVSPQVRWPTLRWRSTTTPHQLNVPSDDSMRLLAPSRVDHPHLGS